MFKNLFKSNVQNPPPSPPPDAGSSVPGLLMQDMTEAERLAHFSEKLGIPVKKRLLEDIRFEGNSSAWGWSLFSRNKGF